MLQPTSASRDGDCNHCVYETPGIVRAPQSFQCIRSLNSQGEFSQMSKVRCPNKATHDKQPEGHLISRAPRKAVCAPDTPPPYFYDVQSTECPLERLSLVQSRWMLSPLE